jgi:predicted ester cyclase
MSLDDHKALSRRELQMWASDNTDTAEDFLPENYINHQESDVEGGVTVKNLEAWKDLLKGYHHGFSSSNVKILMQIAEGDFVATRWEITATQTGDYMGLSPTNKEITWRGVQISRFEKDKIVESWIDWDKYGLFQGLGLVK